MCRKLCGPLPTRDDTAAPARVFHRRKPRTDLERTLLELYLRALSAGDMPACPVTGDSLVYGCAGCRVPATPGCGPRPNPDD